MAEVGNCDDRKRKLPLWMLGVAAADQVRKSAKEDRIHLSLDKNVTNEAEDANCLWPRPRMTDKIEGDMDLKNSTSNCEPTKKAKRRRQSMRASCEYQSSENEFIEPLSVKGQKVDCNSRHLANESLRRFEKENITDKEEDSEIDNEYFDTEETQGRSRNLGRNKMKADKRRNNAKSKQKNSRRITHKAPKTKTKDYENCEKSMKSQSSCGEDCDSEIELTLDDLMHMAQEHVKSDREKENQKAVVEKPTSKAQCLSTLVVSENNNCDLLANDSAWRVSKCSSSAMASNHYDIGEETGKSLDGSVLPMDNRTGDPKVDLLDVFLGPLIRKPQKEVKKVEPVLEGVILSGDDKRQLMTNTLMGNEALVMKKKSSLRDKVDMFLG